MKGKTNKKSSKANSKSRAKPKKKTAGSKKAKKVKASDLKKMSGGNIWLSSSD